jgi:hypothetical protein
MWPLSHTQCFVCHERDAVVVAGWVAACLRCLPKNRTIVFAPYLYEGLVGTGRRRLDEHELN